jgi:hypothetical protein
MDHSKNTIEVHKFYSTPKTVTGTLDVLRDPAEPLAIALLQNILNIWAPKGLVGHVLPNAFAALARVARCSV